MVIRYVALKAYSEAQRSRIIHRQEKQIKEQGILISFASEYTVEEELHSGDEYYLFSLVALVS